MYRKRFNVYSTGNDAPPGWFASQKKNQVINEIENTEAKSETESSPENPISGDTPIDYDDSGIVAKAAEIGMVKDGYEYTVEEA